MVCHVDHTWGRPAWKNPVGCHDVSSGVIFHRMIPGGFQTLTVQSLQLLLPDFPLQRANSDKKKCVAGWWFQNIFFIFPYIGNNDPNWLIFFRGVGQPPTRWDDRFAEAVVSPWDKVWSLNKDVYEPVRNGAPKHEWVGFQLRFFSRIHGG